MFEQPIPTLQRDGDTVRILDQTLLPFRTETVALRTLAEAAHAIRSMQVRGAPLIGATAAFGVALALAEEGADDATLARALATLGATRPTAVNLHWALERMRRALQPLPPAARVEAAWAEAEAIRADDAATCDAIGRHGVRLIREIAARRPGPVRLMTHCNAGWLATCGAGTALAPVYAAQAEGIAVAVVVSETRPRNQGLLTAWELRAAGVPHLLIADNAAGLLLMRHEVDLVITGADRIAANGDTANKVGTYADGAAIPIEDRGADEVLHVRGETADGATAELALAPAGTRAANPAFDLTPAALITGIVTERGIARPGELARLYPEQVR